jgi:hypothetical protein
MTTAPAESSLPTRTAVTASDGVTLAVHAYTEIDPRRPTVLAVHGYPDNHHLWDGVAEHLLDDRTVPYNFVAYDVRGAGESERPASRSDYRFSQLISDVGAVIDSLGVGRVHLLAHDWAQDVLTRLADDSYDLVFIDADPLDQPDYVVEGVRLLRSGGVIVVHGAAAGGRAGDPAAHDAEVAAVREAARLIAENEQLTPALVPLGDGLLAAVRD